VTYAEAKATLFGRPVVAWTAMNGVYVGVLEEIFGSPWRGTVRVTGTITPAVAFEQGRWRQRHGFRPGDTLEVGGKNISGPAEAAGSSYLDALEYDLERLREMLAQSGPKDIWHLERSIAIRQEQIAEESARG
jgi:hypothetical protein